MSTCEYGASKWLRVTWNWSWFRQDWERNIAHCDRLLTVSGNFPCRFSGRGYKIVPVCVSACNSALSHTLFRWVNLCRFTLSCRIRLWGEKNGHGGPHAKRCIIANAFSSPVIFFVSLMSPNSVLGRPTIWLVSGKCVTKTTWNICTQEDFLTQQLISIETH